MDDSLDQTSSGLNVMWLFLCVVLVILMQAGFAAYEVGSIHRTSTEHILLKNIGDAAIAFAAWCATGYAIANGDENDHVIGSSHFFLSGGPFAATENRSSAESILVCVFGWAFSAACITIMSGAVADRVPVMAYYVYSLLTALFFYPMVAHAAWGEGGLFKAKEKDAIFGCGVLDFAGSGVVHMFGGLLSLVLAWWYGPRDGRIFKPNELHEEKHLKNCTDVGQINEKDFRRNDPTWMTIGALLLWLGCENKPRRATGRPQLMFYVASPNPHGYKVRLQLRFDSKNIDDENQNAAGRAAFNTTIGAAFGAASSVAFELLYHIWSPKYRHENEYEIRDPLHEERKDPKDLEAPRDLEAIRNQQQEHNTKRWQWVKLKCVWAYSTHKSLHGAISNGILAGLVTITAGCATMPYSWAIVATCLGVGLYHLSYRSIICCCKIDDAVGASAIHGFVGFWGLVAASGTANGSERMDAGYPTTESCSLSDQLAANLLFGLFIFGCVVICGLILVLVLTKCGADPTGASTIFGQNCPLTCGGGRNEGLPERNPELDNALRSMDKRYDLLRTELTTLKSDVSNLQRGVPGDGGEMKHQSFAPDAADD